jgi:hypothetical protein
MGLLVLFYAVLAGLFLYLIKNASTTMPEANLK